MKANFALVAGLASTVLAGPLALRDAATDLAALTATVKVHTANINNTLATLPAASTTTSSNSTGNANITAEFNLIALAMNSSSSAAAKRGLPLFPRDDPSVIVAACDATCMLNTYTGLGALTAEIAYTAKACVDKNAVDISSSSSVLVKVLKGLTAVTGGLQDTVGTIAGIVVQNLNAALGPDIGGALALFITSS